MQKYRDGNGTCIAILFSKVSGSGVKLTLLIYVLVIFPCFREVPYSCRGRGKVANLRFLGTRGLWALVVSFSFSAFSMSRGAPWPCKMKCTGSSTSTQWCTSSDLTRCHVREERRERIRLPMDKLCGNFGPETKNQVESPPPPRQTPSQPLFRLPPRQKGSLSRSISMGKMTDRPCFARIPPPLFRGV